jgi:hypothetical protein
MARGEYNAFRGWSPPEGEDQSTAGYLVEYLDGGKANVPGHLGYVSWSPADVFEGSYVHAGDAEGLEPYQVRVVAEHAMLASNISKLVSFISRPGFTELPRDEQHRMVRQRRAMEEYADALSERIANFKKT